MEPIDLGHIKVIFRKTSLPPLEKKVPSKLQSQQVSLEEAKKMVDYRLWQPVKFPEGDFKLADTHVGIDTETQEVVTIITKHKDDLGRWFVFGQNPLRIDNESKGEIVIPFPMWQGQIKNQTAAFFQQKVTAKNQPNGQLTITHCYWEQEDLLMELQGPWTVQELIQVGTSIR